MFKVNVRNSDGCNNLFTILIVEQPHDFPLTTAIIALADYAIEVLHRDQKRMEVAAPKDPPFHE